LVARSTKPSTSWRQRNSYKFRHAQDEASQEQQEQQEQYDKAKELYRNAQIKLGMAIEEQTNRPAGDSSLYPPGRGLKNCGKVRQQEKRILDGATPPSRKRLLEEAIQENRSLRAPRELKALNQMTAATQRKLNAAQVNEGRHIIADATDAVTGKREGDDDLTREQVIKNQLERLTKLLDGVTGEAQKFDPILYGQLIDNIRAQMGRLDPADNASFDTLVRKYSERLAPD
jgi:hypothetical protein